MTDENKPNVSQLRRIVFFAIGILVSALALEGLLQLAAVVSPQAAAVLDRHAGLLLPDATLIHRPNPAYPEHDEWGFRNAAVPEHAFAVALGDSQTYGAMVPRDDAWPQQLASAIGQPVYNMAFGGYGAGEASLLLEQALKLNPKWVLFGLYTGNDLFDAYELTYKTSSLNNQQSTDPGIRAAIAAAEANGAIESGFRETHSTRAMLKQWLGDHCKLYGLARAIRNATRGSAWQEDDLEWNSIVDQKTLHPDWVPVNDATSPTMLTPAYRLLALNRDDPRIQEGERITFALLLDMATRCTKSGATLMVVALPTKEYVYRGVGSVQETAALTKVWNAEDAFWSACRSFCSEHDIPMADSVSALREGLAAGDRPFRRDADGHLTRAGNNIVVRVVRARIAPKTK